LDDKLRKCISTKAAEGLLQAIRGWASTKKIFFCKRYILFVADVSEKVQT